MTLPKLGGMDPYEKISVFTGYVDAAKSLVNGGAELNQDVLFDLTRAALYLTGQDDPQSDFQHPVLGKRHEGPWELEALSSLGVTACLLTQLSPERAKALNPR